MEYVALTDMPFYRECAPLVAAQGLALVELRVAHLKGGAQAKVVIASKSPQGTVGIGECALVHRALAPVLDALLEGEDLGMEVTSPGMERNVKNGAEFVLFTGRRARVWDKRTSDWRSGVIAASTETAVTLELDGSTEEIPFAEIAKAKLL